MKIYLYNGLGDIVGLIDSSNKVVVRYQYNRWGKVTSMKKGYLIAASVINGVNTMGKRCIWNYDHKKIEYLEERGKKLKFEKVFELSMGIIAGIFSIIGLLVFINLILKNVVAGVIFFPACVIWICAAWVQIYSCMISYGEYYLDQDGIQLVYYKHICRKIYWKDIEVIERRIISSDSREQGENSECEIFYVAKKGYTEKEKKAKARGMIFYANHWKRIIFIGYSKEREAEFRKYWDKEIKDQRKWTKGLTFF